MLPQTPILTPTNIKDAYYSAREGDSSLDAPRVGGLSLGDQYNATIYILFVLVILLLVSVCVLVWIDLGQFVNQPVLFFLSLAALVLSIVLCVMYQPQPAVVS